MKLREKQTLLLAQSDGQFMDELLQSEDAEKFIKYVIKSFTKRPALFMQQHKVEWEDLYQACLIGLFNGIKKVDTELSPNEWVRFLYLNIQGEIRSFSRSNNSNSIRISQRIRELYPKYIVFHKNFHQKYDRDPTIKETMDEFNLSKEDSFDLVYGTLELLSMNKYYEKDGSKFNIAHLTRDPNANVERIAVNKILVETYLSNITDIQKDVLHMHYFLGYNKSEIANHIGCSSPMVQKHINNAFTKIKRIV